MRASSRSSTARTPAAPIELPRGGTGRSRRRRPATTSSPPAATRCWAPTTRPAWPRSWPRSRYLAAHPECPRPTLRVCFTPDEEIGEGATLFDVEAFGAVCAYTLDGSDLGELQDETFAAEEVSLTIHGVDAHPGWAKDVLVNAARLAGEVLAALPADLTPERTDGREGFIHPYEVAATGGKAVVRAIVRDFDDDKLAAHTALLRRTAEEVVAARAGRAARGRRHAAVPEHAPLRRAVPAGHRAGRARDPSRGHRAGPDADPRRHRRLTPERDGPADAEPVHGRP